MLAPVRSLPLVVFTTSLGCTSTAPSGPAACAPEDGGCVSDASSGSTKDARDRYADRSPPHDASTVDGLLNAVTATDSGWIAVGARKSAPGSFALTSTDGRAWRSEEVPPDCSFVDVAFGNGAIVAVGTGVRANSGIGVKPPNGPWQCQLFGTNLDQVIFGNSTFLATYGVEPGAKVSMDGIQWTRSPIGASWFGFVDGKFAAFGYYGPPPQTMGFLTSTDGLSWSDPVAPTAPIYGIEVLADVGDETMGFGITCDTPDCPVDPPPPLVEIRGARGRPLSELEVTPSPISPLPFAIASSATRVVVLSRNLRMSTQSFLSTTSVPVGSAPWSEVDIAARGWTLVDVAYAHGKFVAVGTRGLTESVIVTSVDGISWEEAGLP
jgi:hypothetical protein